MHLGVRPADSVLGAMGQGPGAGGVRFLGPTEVLQLHAVSSFVRLL